MTFEIVASGSDGDAPPPASGTFIQSGGMPIWMPILAVLAVLIIGTAAAAMAGVFAGDSPTPTATVAQLQIVDVWLEPENPEPGQPFTIHWDVTGAVEIDIAPLVIALNPDDGQYRVDGGVPAGTTLTLRAFGADGSSEQERQITVGGGVAAAETPTPEPPATATAENAPTATEAGGSPTETPESDGSGGQDPASTTTVATRVVIRPNATIPVGLTPQVQPTEAEVETAAGPPPAEGRVVWETNFNNWQGFDRATVAGFYRDGSYHLRIVAPDGSYSSIADAQTYDTTLADYSVSVDLRLVEGTGSSLGCLAVRTNYDESTQIRYSYNLCMSSIERQSLGFYFGRGPDGQPGVTELLAAGVYESAKPANEWNQLKIIARGHSFWFFINGTLVGSAIHEAELTGAVGIQVYALDLTPAEWEFTNLTYRSIV